MKMMSPSVLRQCVFFTLLIPSIVNAQGLNGFQTNLAAGTVHAAAQIGGAMGLFLVVTALGGTLMVISTIKRYMNAESNERETMNGGKLLAGISLGTLAVIFPFVIALGHNTLWAGDPITAQSFGALAIDGSLARQSATEIQEGQGPGRYVPGAALVAFYGILMLIGSISIYMGIRDAWIAIMYGNDMYGTSMPFKSSKVLGHLIFGFGLIFINQAQCMVILTVGGPENMCW
jgi:hypothetical protein